MSLVLAEHESYQLWAEMPPVSDGMKVIVALERQLQLQPLNHVLLVDFLFQSQDHFVQLLVFAQMQSHLRMLG
jgi:hypothetical protein